MAIEFFTSLVVHRDGAIRERPPPARTPGDAGRTLEGRGRVCPVGWGWATFLPDIVFNPDLYNFCECVPR